MLLLSDPKAGDHLEQAD